MPLTNMQPTMLTRTLIIASSAALFAACSNQDGGLGQAGNPYGVPQADPYGSVPAPVTGERNPAPYQPLPNVAETGTYAPETTAPAAPVPPADDVYGGLSPSTPPPASKPAAPAQAATGAGTTVVVAKGDTLWGFSKKYGVSVDAIRAANNIPAGSNNVRLGQKLVIPAH